MPHQSAVTVIAEVPDGAADGVRQLLATMGDGVANGRELDLGALTGLHFARVVLVEAATGVDGTRLPASLIYMSDIDVSPAAHLAELVDTNGPGLDGVFGACAGYPGPSPTRDQRLAWLRAHVVREPARYVNTIGRTSEQIRREAELRDRVEQHLDARHDELARGTPADVHGDVRRLVDGDESLAWARVPAEGLDAAFRIREAAHAIAWALVLIVLLPLILIGLPFYVILLRIHERRDEAPHVKPPPDRVRELASLEDHLVHNPFTAVGFVKPGLFRKLTIRMVLMGIDYSTRHVFNRGSLAGVKTIHFARWIYLDGGRRVLFASNYDGSLESYMDDFIDKIAWGLNIVFSNGVGYPRARFLILDGARDELAFKDYLRAHQVETRVWHSAYGRLTSANIATNERLRKGLQHEPGADEARVWAGVP